jgi:uncharacterized membrane protein YfcA
VETYLLFFVASIAAGKINALAGGGGLITFPLLMLVVLPVIADATSAIACLSAYPTAVWRTRSQLHDVAGRGWFWLLLIPSVLGGLVGALMLSRAGNRSFVEWVPWLILLATLIILLRPILVRRGEGDNTRPHFAAALWPVAIAGIFVVAVYGGYFRAGIGILMIGALTFISPGDIRHVVALKNVLNGCLRGVAVVVVIEGNVGSTARRWRLVAWSAAISVDCCPIAPTARSSARLSLASGLQWQPTTSGNHTAQRSCA